MLAVWRTAYYFTFAVLLEFDECWRVAAFAEWDCFGVIEIDIITIALNILESCHAKGYFLEYI
jgi:hypothetical protein